MPKVNEKPTERVHLHLFKDDWEWLKRAYGPGSSNPELSVSEVARSVIAKFVRTAKSHTEQQLERSKGQ